MKKLILWHCVAAFFILAMTASGRESVSHSRRFRVRTITAGVNLSSPSDVATIEKAIAFLERAKKVCEDSGYEVQTLRIATQPLPEYLGARSRDEALDDLKKLDRAVSEKRVLLNIGPAITDDRFDREFAAWAARLVAETASINFSVIVASAERGIHGKTARSAAEAIVAIGKSSPGGEGNFRFTASANCPPGSPFFPAAYHRGPEDFAIGLESANLVRDAFQDAADVEDAKKKLKTVLETALQPVERIAEQIAKSESRPYGGIDVSPAPAKDASIGAAIEALTHAPFGNASTLLACASITDVLRSLDVKRCGYSGLMLPVLEDPVLATRAAEHRYGVRELLLYSSVCGTGLDVVPLPGDTPAETMAALIRDVAALSAKWNKPLSARLFPVPDKHAGEQAKFHNPFLTDSVIMKLD